MPILFGNVFQQITGGQIPCMDFTVHCVNKPHLDPVFSVDPPNFMAVLARGSYEIKVTSLSTGGFQTQTANLFSKTGGGASLQFLLP